MSSQAPSSAFPDNVARHVAKGELGRAREVLASRLQQTGFAPDVLEQLGWVLLKMGDHAEAGRYLFLSGSQHADYRPAIEAFLGRCRRTDLRQFVSQWSSSLRKARIRDLPAPVVAELLARGMPGECQSSARLEDLRRARSAPSRSWTRLLCAVLAVGVVAYLVVRALT